MRDRQRYNDYHREYQRKYQLEKYHARRAEAIELLGGSCVVCGATEKLNIDHKDSSDKKYEISSLFSRRREVWLEELGKCQLLCEYHHKEKTRICRDNPQMFSRNEHLHGCGYQYVVKDCRCQPCKVWQFLYKRREVLYSDVLTPQQIDSVKQQKEEYNTGGISHGTRAGYLKEGRLGVERCDACKEANAKYTRDRKRPG